MDMKASARAKHASSQRGRARHSTRKHHPQQQQQQQAGKDAALPQPSPDKTAPSLPSNWSRYEEEDDLPVDDRLSDVPAVKSKGANYRDLLAEKSIFQAPDLTSGRKNLMVAHGKDLWARLRDVDNIWKVSNEEGSFFTLDLDFISKELAKVDIAERLFVDSKYIPSEERIKDSMTKTYDEDENKTISSQANKTTSEASVSTKAPASPHSKEVQSSSTTVSKEGGKGSMSADFRQFEEAVTTSSTMVMPADSSQSNKLEDTEVKLPQLHNKVHRVLKDTLAELPKTTDNRFEAQSAEAELDALLDMLDDKSAGEASNLFPSKSLGYAKSQGAVSQRSSYIDVLQENAPLDLSVDSISGSSSKLMIGTSNDSLRDMKGSFDTAIKVDNLPSQTLHVGNVTSAPGSSEVVVRVENVSSEVSAVGNASSMANIDDDFDDWLDSL